MPSIPRDASLDSSLAFMRDPYRFVSDRCRRFGTNLLQTRLLLSRFVMTDVKLHG